MNTAIEFHDSECVAVEADSVLLRAYVHRSTGRAGLEAGEGGTQLVRFVLENLNVQSDVGQLPAYLYEGSVHAGDAVFDNLITLPSEYVGDIRFSMTLSEDARLVSISGTKLTVVTAGDFTFVEHFNPASEPVWSD